MEQKVELLPLTNDYVFKRVFTKDGEEDLLKDLLSAILNIEIKEIEVHYIELPKFIKKNPGVKTKLEQWLWLICGEEGGKVEMAKKENEKVKEASEVLERMSMSYEERWLYDQRMLRKMDEMSLKEHAKQERTRRTD